MKELDWQEKEKRDRRENIAGAAIIGYFIFLMFLPQWAGIIGIGAFYCYISYHNGKTRGILETYRLTPEDFRAEQIRRCR